MAVHMIGYTPKTSDGRQIILPSTMRDSYDVGFCGQGDDVDNGVNMAGQELAASLSSSGSTTVTWQFISSIDIAGGVLKFSGAEWGDYLSYDVVAPATAGTSNPGAGLYDKYPIGEGANMYVPNGTMEGDWDLDLDETLNANVSFTKVVPVPSSGDGFFDYDSASGAVTLNATGTGGYYLFDFEMVLSRFLHKIWIYGTGREDFIVPASYGAKALLPHWQHRVTLHKAGDTGTLECRWFIFLGRSNTQPG